MSDPPETADDLRAALRRNHPELTDADITRILSGPPVKPKRAPGLYDNRGRYESPFGSVSTGRTSGPRRSIRDRDD